MANREEILNRFNETNEKLNEIRKELDAIDYEKRFENVNKFVGKYFQEVVTESHPECIIVFYVYGIDKQSCNLQAIRAHYTKESDGYFGIEDALHFDPSQKDWTFESKEITKEEFQAHYAQAIERIQSIIKP